MLQQSDAQVRECAFCNGDLFHKGKRDLYQKGKKNLCCSKVLLGFVSVCFAKETYRISVKETYIKRTKETCVAAKRCSVS